MEPVELQLPQTKANDKRLADELRWQRLAEYSFHGVGEDME